MTEAEARTVVAGRAMGRCEVCRRQANNWAHRVARSQGGLWTPSNGVLMCGSGTTGCHGWCHHNRPDARTGGWILDAGADPREVAVWLAPLSLWPGWWFLEDDGTLTAAGDAPRPVLPAWAIAA